MRSIFFMSAQRRGEQDVYAILLILRRQSGSKDRIKTTIGLSQKTYVKLKLLSTVLKRDMQDIIEEALQEYFKRDDIRAVLSAIFKTDSELAGQG